MRTWKIDGPPEIVLGMVMNVITSCSLRPASRARKPPIAWMPSCELPAMRMTASEILEIFGPEPVGAASAESLMMYYKLTMWETAKGGVGAEATTRLEPVKQRSIS